MLSEIYWDANTLGGILSEKKHSTVNADQQGKQEWVTITQITTYLKTI